jgi:hypothetical protein
MADKTGVARLRQATENQASEGEACFSLPIGEAATICVECENELAALLWAKDVPAPKDADGEVVPLGTEELYTDDGEMVRVGSICYGSRLWHVRRMCSGKTYWLDSLHLRSHDSWEKLEEDAKLAPRAYLEKRGMNPEKTERVASMMADLVSRAKALAERDAKGADCD